MSSDTPTPPPFVEEDPEFAKNHPGSITLSQMRYALNYGIRPWEQPTTNNENEENNAD